MACPSPMRAISPDSDASSSIQSCIAVKPMRDSSPPSDESHGASSTPPTSVNETPSIASDQPRSPPKRSAIAVEDNDADPKRSTRRRISKQGASDAVPLNTAGRPNKLKSTSNRASATTKPSKKGGESGGKITVKGAKYLSLQSWLSQSQRVHEGQGPQTQSAGLKRKRKHDALIPEEAEYASERDGNTSPRHALVTEPEVSERSTEPIISPPHASRKASGSRSDVVNEDEEPNSKRVKTQATTSKREGREGKQSLSGAAAAKVGAIAAHARKVVSSARRSAREVAAKVTSATTAKSNAASSVHTDTNTAGSRARRRSTRDANAAPSNEEKAATALQQDSKKMQNKRMMTKGKFSTGPVDEVMPLPNNWYIGKFGGTNDTYLKDFQTARGFKLSAEIFNPQPGSFVREGKDWAVTKGAKNVFAGNARAMWAKSDFANLPQSFCTCKPADACGADCLNRIMEYECNDNNCVIGAGLCKNRPFADLMKRLEKAEAVNNRQKELERIKSEEEKRRPKYASVAMSFDQGVEVFEAAGKGYGVRAQRSFEPDQIIMEYFGEIIDQEEVEKRMATTYKDSTDFYMMQFHDGFILDATKGSMARFVNHACEPNCEIRKMLVSTGVGKKKSVEPRMALFAGKNGIQFNEELTYDYNFDPFSTRNVQKCLCGSANCRGILGPRPPKERANTTSNGVVIKDKGTTKTKSEVARVTAVTKTKTGVLATSSILKAAKRARF